MADDGDDPDFVVGDRVASRSPPHNRGSITFVSKPGRKPLVRVRWDGNVDEWAAPPHTVRKLSLPERIGELDA